MCCFMSLHSHQSGEVSMGSFCRVDSLAGRLPGMLSALEEHDFLFQLHLSDIPQDDSNEVMTEPNGMFSYCCDGDASVCCMCKL